MAVKPLVELRRPAPQNLGSKWDRHRVDQHINDNIDRLNTAFAYFEQEFVHGAETLFPNPFGVSSIKQPIALFSGVAEDDDGSPLAIASYKISAPRTDGQVGITVEYDLRHTEPGAEFTRTSGQSLGASAEVPIQWNSSTITGSAISLVSNSRITIAEPGWYVFTGTVGIAPNAAPRLFACWRENGNAADYGNLSLAAPVGGGNNNYRHTSLQRSLSAGDYVELIAFQDSGVPINTVADYTQCQVSRTRNDSTPTGIVRGYLLAGA